MKILPKRNPPTEFYCKECNDLLENTVDIEFGVCEVCRKADFLSSLKGNTDHLYWKWWNEKDIRKKNDLANQIIEQEMEE